MSRHRDPATGKFVSNSHVNSNVARSVSNMDKKLKQLQSTIASLRLSNLKHLNQIKSLNKSKAAYIKQINKLKLQQTQPTQLLDQLYSEIEIKQTQNSQLEKQLVSYLIPSNLIQQTIKTLNEEYNRYFKSLKYRYILSLNNCKLN